MKYFKELINRPGFVPMIGSYDALSAKMVDQAGFPCVYMTGYGASASSIGMPDIGLMTMTETVRQARTISNVIDKPLIVDADNGYGGIPNVIRTVQEYEKAGVSCIQMEDQVFPKRCGHMANKQLISTEEMVSKIKAAVYAKESEDFMIIARTDATDVNGIDDAIERAKRYADAGADILYIESPESTDDMEYICKAIPDYPHCIDIVEGGKIPFLSFKELEQIGYKMAIYPVSTLYAASWAIKNVLNIMMEKETSLSFQDQMLTFGEFNKIIGLDKIRELEMEFL